MPPDSELERLRGELLERLDARPWRDWSRELLLAVIGVLDLTAPSVDRRAGARLRVVK